MRHFLFITALCAIIWCGIAESSQAMQPVNQNVDQVAEKADEIAERVDRLEKRFQRTGTAFLLFLFAAFSALWAQNTNRNPWLWFFCGYFFHVFAVLVLLAKNADDKKLSRGEPAQSANWIVGIALLGALATAAVAVWLYFSM